ncbi:2-oxo-4-hydroxy-4-carboxy-5-ureidoimidazoline decarboxylase [Neisseriaceae bacterium TC5R-5]|nr:2-oxo-4-hydroxy-4-carboxy-5-ureidoimidazoline decarboxylase [Neisseriaceae bacterium TC5R-5]
MKQAHTLAMINALPAAEFVQLLSGIFEHSAWVAEQVVHLRPFARVAELHACMVQQVELADEATQLQLIRAHPELAGKAALRGELTNESTSEQSGAGLDQCSAAELALLQKLNSDYNARFGFPFILAVKGYDRVGIIAEFQRRLSLSPDEEKRVCLQQIYRIANFRLNTLIVA